MVTQPLPFYTLGEGVCGERRQLAVRVVKFLFCHDTGTVVDLGDVNLAPVVDDEDPALYIVEDAGPALESPGFRRGRSILSGLGKHVDLCRVSVSTVYSRAVRLLRELPFLARRYVSGHSVSAIFGDHR